MLRGQIALVTGASRGIGRGIALQLGEAGATVYVTGREPSKSDAAKAGDLPTLEVTAREVTERGGKGIAVYCDHSNSNDIKALFERIDKENEGRLDILVNNAFSAVNTITRAMGKPFWECEPSMWDEINDVGLRNHYYCTVYASRLMAARKTGLIVIISSPGGLKYTFNVPYGVGKAAKDRLAADAAHELYKYNVTAVSLWPGPVRTELVVKNFTKPDKNDSKVGDLNNDELRSVFDRGETIEYSGRCIVHLAKDPQLKKKTGRILLTTDLAAEYGFSDINGQQPSSIRSLKNLLVLGNWKKTSWFVPEWVRLPGWLLTAGTSKL